jgi:phage terminase large subunit-like protein
LIPYDNIVHATPRGNVPGAVDSVTIKSGHGGISRLLFQSYDQGRESFQASKIDVMQFDEEPPSEIYTEGLTRTMSTVPGEPNGLVICGFTPLRGLSAVVLSYMPGGERVEGAVQGRPV